MWGTGACWIRRRLSSTTPRSRGLDHHLDRLGDEVVSEPAEIGPVVHEPTIAIGPIGGTEAPHCVSIDSVLSHSPHLPANPQGIFDLKKVEPAHRIGAQHARRTSRFPLTSLSCSILGYATGRSPQQPRVVRPVPAAAFREFAHRWLISC